MTDDPHEAKRDGMERADAHAAAIWKATMEQLVVDTACELRFFTTDDVYDRFDNLPDQPDTHEKRALGPIMNRAARNGVCQKAELPHRISHRAACHCRPIQVWESLIYELSDTYLDIDGAC